MDIYNSETSQLHTDEALLRHPGSPPALRRRHTAPGRISGVYRSYAAAWPHSPPGSPLRLRHHHATCTERPGQHNDRPNTVRLRHSDIRGWKFPSIEGG